MTFNQELGGNVAGDINHSMLSDGGLVNPGHHLMYMMQNDPALN